MMCNTKQKVYSAVGNLDKVPKACLGGQGKLLEEPIS